MSKAKPSRLLAEERRREILDLLGQNGRITVDEVAKHFQVSAVTARCDLDALSKEGALVRSHGGGVRPLTAAPEQPLLVREGIHQGEKIRIARAAFRLIQPLQTVILCTGSTSAALADQIRRNPVKNIAVITYALSIAVRLSDVPNLSLLMLGGFLRSQSTALVGPHAEQMMQSLHADHCFMGTVGIDTEIGITTIDVMEAQLNRCLMQSAREVTLLADSSKFGHRSLSLISDLRNIKRVITDSNASTRDLDRLRDLGVEVIVV